MIHGDALDVLPGFAPASVHACVTDPPYGLSTPPKMEAVLADWLAGREHRPGGGGFMGREWDAFVPGPAVWREVFRVLKPGGHVVAFGGSRTYDLVVLSLRLAGFEIRDQIFWAYGSGFPKSLDVGKAVDASDTLEPRRVRALKFTAWMRSTGITAGQINAATGTGMASHYLTAAAQPEVTTLEMFGRMRHLLPEPPPEIWEIMRARTVESENLKRRPVTAREMGRDTRRVRPGVPLQGNIPLEFCRTAPATEAAREWDGWGTALKPAHEPIVLARKPLAGTVAETVLEHGTGAIHVDACRAELEAHFIRYATAGTGKAGTHLYSGDWPGEARDMGHPESARHHPSGRWPANLVHDGSLEAVSGLGEAARYFYCAKASREDREEGLAGMAGRAMGFSGGAQGHGEGYEAAQSIGLNRVILRKNTHPTVKPTALMGWLCRMVCPPGGLVLDPFCGSGSTGKAAVLDGFRFSGMEREPEFVEISRARIAHAATAMGLALDIGPGPTETGPAEPVQRRLF
ncbi:MAG: DNA methyltransferase [Pseudomonadota bacterium]